MEWLLLFVLVAAAGGVLVLLFVRSNRLSMNRSLTAEALRQFVFFRSARHSLVPTYLVAAREATGDTVEARRLENAAESARQSAESAHTGPAEYRVTTCVIELDALVRRVPADGIETRRSTSRALARDLFRQLRMQETQISAAVRQHNSSVRAYESRRSLLTSLPLRWVFRPVQEIDYAPAGPDDDAELPAPSLDGEGYRPGRVSEDL